MPRRVEWMGGGMGNRKAKSEDEEQATGARRRCAARWLGEFMGEGG
jgi:hypothetical protein